MDDKTEHDMPIDDDRRSEGYKWCRLHGWFFATCDKCLGDRMDKERYKDQERLWELADQANCEGDCDKDSPHKQCGECLARSVINECGEIFRNALREIDGE